VIVDVGGDLSSNANKYLIQVKDWERVRSLMEHENELVDHRQTWLLSSQAFLFGGFAAIFTNYKGELTLPIKGILLIIALFAVLICIVLWQSILQGQKQHHAARDWFRKTYATPEHESDGIGTRHPPLTGRHKTMLSPAWIPGTIILAWIAASALACYSQIQQEQKKGLTPPTTTAPVTQPVGK
jgi:hypothetical protein